MTVEYTALDVASTTAQEFTDSDPPAATAINPLGEAAFNTAHFAALRVGAYRIVDFDDAVSSSGGATLLTTADAAYGTDPLELGSVTVEAGDLVKITVDAHVAIGLNPSTGELKLYTLIGANPAVDVPGGKNILATAFSTEKSVHIAGTAHAAHAGVMRVFLDAKVAGGETLIVEEPIACAIEVLRSNA